ncbi:MAG: 2-oxoacid:acceptor oxidoreductase family protein [Anaerolineales bacterium]|nr:2-oxoacid:acceptor oxidoreductase family protein [Anaerolineales bacterium]
MQTEIIISGFGGQGALFAGQLLAYTGLDHGLHVTWFPSYGPEMRGGTAHCTVILSDDEIGSPVVKNPSAAIVMNIPSLEKYEPLVASDGVLVVNTSLIDRHATRQDIDIIEVPANEIAEELGEKRLANLVLTGALIERLGVLTIEQVGKSLGNHIPEHRRNLLESNREALQRGAEIAQRAVQPG